VVGGILAGLSAVSIPRGYGQNPDIYPEIPVGVAINPVTLDGRVTAEEYDSDCVDNPYRASHSSSPEPVHLYVKDDGLWTRIGVDSLFPANTTKPNGGYLSLSFDTNNTGGRLEEGIYTLDLQFKGNDAAQEGTVQSFRIGALFREKFKKGQDYDWQSTIGSSPLSEIPHRQFEVQILSEILTKYARTINFSSGYNDGNVPGVFIQGSEGNRSWARMAYKGVPVPEFPFAYLVAFGAVGGSALILNRARTNAPSARRTFGKEVAAYCIAGLIGLAGVLSSFRLANGQEMSIGSNIPFAELECAEQDRIG
jgi:hypothetical protein